MPVLEEKVTKKITYVCPECGWETESLSIGTCHRCAYEEIENMDFVPTDEESFNYRTEMPPKRCSCCDFSHRVGISYTDDTGHLNSYRGYICKKRSYPIFIPSEDAHISVCDAHENEPLPF